MFPNHEEVVVRHLVVPLLNSRTTTGSDDEDDNNFMQMVASNVSNVSTAEQVLVKSNYVQVRVVQTSYFVTH